jgi:hypothetical protein
MEAPATEAPATPSSADLAEKPETELQVRYLQNFYDFHNLHPLSPEASTTSSSLTPTSQLEAPPTLEAPAPARLGTASAQQEAPMKKAEDMLKTAESAQQNLPSESRLDGHASPALNGEAATANSPVQAEHLHFVHPSAATASTVTATSSAAPASELPPVAPEARLSALERTHELVALHAVRLGETNAETMRVVIEPGAGMHLALELRWHKDGVDIQASVNRSDYDFLSRHWGELQQRLEPRGIHLGALECPNASVGDHSASQHSERQFTGEEPAPRAVPEFALSGSTNEPPALQPARRQAYQGWETWA